MVKKYLCKSVVLISAAIMLIIALNACELVVAPDKNAINDPIKIKDGQIFGEVVDEDGTRVHIYRGIPYAAPPVGNLRWRPPQAVKPWKDVRNCTKYADRAPQAESTEGEEDIGGISEDCLYLNVVTAAQKSTEKLPVMVFFHGGGLSTHTGNSPVYCNTALPRKGVVVVTVNSRLGALGYMAHPALTKESWKNVSGNYGTLDLIKSLVWVQKNIMAFGGDPANVTIFGESGGGSKVLSVMSSPLAKGLFHRAIIESGSMSSSEGAVTTLEEAEALGEKIAAKLGVDGEQNVLQAMRGKSWEEILQASSAPEVGFMANLTVDGYVLPDSVHNIFQSGKQADVPLIVGANEGEGRELSGTIPELAASMQNVKSNAYVYVFSHVPTGWRTMPCVAFHGLELPYVFGRVPDGLYANIVMYLAPGGGCSPDVDPGPDEMDVVVADQMMQLWAEFAATGEPSVKGLVTWPAYESETDLYLDIGYELKVKSGVKDSAVTPPMPEQDVEPVDYTNADYGFSLQYPGNWTEKTEALLPGVVWQAGGGTYSVPAVRCIVREQSDGSDLQQVFAAHIAEDAEKAIDTYEAGDITIGEKELTQAAVTYFNENGTYDGVIVGGIVDDKWLIIEVFSLPPFFAVSDDDRQAIIDSIAFSE